jgi:hypothetical protein
MTTLEFRVAERSEQARQSLNEFVLVPVTVPPVR